MGNLRLQSRFVLDGHSNLSKMVIFQSYRRGQMCHASVSGLPVVDMAPSLAFLCAGSTVPMKANELSQTTWAVDELDACFRQAGLGVSA